MVVLLAELMLELSEPSALLEVVFGLDEFVFEQKNHTFDQLRYPRVFLLVFLHDLDHVAVQRTI